LRTPACVERERAIEPPGEDSGKRQRDQLREQRMQTGLERDREQCDVSREPRASNGKKTKRTWHSLGERAQTKFRRPICAAFALADVPLHVLLAWISRGQPRLLPRPFPSQVFVKSRLIGRPRSSGYG
jgi:hypothetical protein